MRIIVFKQELKKLPGFVLIVLIYIYCTFFNNLFAQNEKSLTAAPFKSGKFWGLMNPDSTIFYPAVFDSVFILIDSSYYAEIFIDYPGDHNMAFVMHEGKVKMLSDEKRLIDTIDYYNLPPSTPLQSWRTAVKTEPAISNFIKWNLGKPAKGKKKNLTSKFYRKNKPLFSFYNYNEDSVRIYDYKGNFYFTSKDTAVSDFTCEAFHVPQYHQFSKLAPGYLIARKKK